MLEVLIELKRPSNAKKQHITLKKFRPRKLLRCTAQNYSDQLLLETWKLLARPRLSPRNSNKAHLLALSTRWLLLRVHLEVATWEFLCIQLLQLKHKINKRFTDGDVLVSKAMFSAYLIGSSLSRCRHRKRQRQASLLQSLAWWGVQQSPCQHFAAATHQRRSSCRCGSRWAVFHPLSTWTAMCPWSAHFCLREPQDYSVVLENIQIGYQTLGTLHHSNYL